MKLKNTLLCLITLLLATLTITAYAAEHCPEIANIERVAGENLWITHYANWEGQFISPDTGRGFSHKLTYFQTASWVALNNLPNSPGYVTCDYSGNIDTEVIRFTQKGKHGSLKPTNPENWSCVDTTSFPSVQCTCTRSETACKFE